MFADELYSKVQARIAAGQHGYGITPIYNLSLNEAQWLQAVADRFGFPPEWLANLVNFESGGTFNPAIQNSIGATGLIQFMPATALGLGTTTSALKAMTFKQQLAYVDRYLQQELESAAAPKGLYNKQTGKVSNAFTQTDLFMLIFYPAAVGNPNYRFPANVVAANNGIETPQDYTNRVLVASTTPFKSISPYIQQITQATTAYASKNKWPIAIAGVGLMGLIITLAVYNSKS